LLPRAIRAIKAVNLLPPAPVATSHAPRPAHVGRSGVGSHCGGRVRDDRGSRGWVPQLCTAPKLGAT
jgi:hypothetical protein